MAFCFRTSYSSIHFVFWVCMFIVCNCENTVHGGLPITTIGFSSLMCLTACLRSSPRSKSHPVERSIDSPGVSPYFLHTWVTLLGEKTSVMSTPRARAAMILLSSSRSRSPLFLTTLISVALTELVACPGPAELDAAAWSPPSSAWGSGPCSSNLSSIHLLILSSPLSSLSLPSSSCPSATSILLRHVSEWPLPRWPNPVFMCLHSGHPSVYP